jgi:arylsulfatase A-like enzyme
MAFAMLLASACTGPTSDTAPLNVLLISIDSLRADHVGVYGYEKATTPTIDRLATEGVLFRNAISTTSWTLPAHAALLTGTYETRHGATIPTAKIDASVATLAEAFRAAGYRTTGFYSGPFLHPYFGFDRGFEEYFDCTSYALEAIADPASGKVHASSHKDITNPRIASSFASAAAGHDGRPFFFFVHMWDVHYELVPPPPYDRMFADADMPENPVRDFRHDRRFRVGTDDATFRSVIALYDGEIRFTDDTIGRMLAVLESNKLLDNTLVVVTSDHGDEFLEHGGKGHKRTLYQEVLHVPLVFWAKRTLSPATSSVSASLVDVAPSIAILAGIDGHDRMDGRPLFRRDGRVDDTPRTALAELRANPRHPRYAAAIRHPLKLLRDVKAGREELFDLERDPREEYPMGASGAAAASLRAALDAHFATRPNDYQPAAPRAEPLPPGMKKRLRELGYLD